jgi:hypothetical protein
MRKISFLILLHLCVLSTFGQIQDKNQLLEDEFDELVGIWLEKSGQLKTYQGVNEYCLNPDFRKNVNETLGLIHHYDSLILNKLNEPSKSSGDKLKEEKKVLKNLSELESGYSVIGFIAHLRSTCLFRNDIERDSEKLKNGVADESYDGKILILEAELRSYLQRIDRLVLRIDDNLHLLHITE